MLLGFINLSHIYIEKDENYYNGIEFMDWDSN